MTVLCLVNLLANTAYSSIAPFYPQEATNKGVHKSAIGFIFAGYSLSMFLFSPLFSTMLTQVGRKNVLILGCFLEGLAMIGMGFFDLIDDPKIYGTLCFLCRSIEGFGNGCLNSSSNSIICYKYED